MEPSQFDDRYAAAQMSRRHSGFRRRIRRFYLERILKFVVGPTLDIGCGAGQLLELLPRGSRGLEVNPALVGELRAAGLDVEQVDPLPGRVGLGAPASGRFASAVLSHVLEHFDDADRVLRQLLTDCAQRRIGRLVVVVPGQVGYRSDSTHRTFVTERYLRERNLLAGEGFRVVHHSYFPGDFAFIGRLFIYHELMVVYDIDPSTP